MVPTDVAKRTLFFCSILWYVAEGEGKFFYYKHEHHGWDIVYCTGGKRQRDRRVAEQLKNCHYTERRSTEFILHAFNRTVSIFLMGVGVLG